MWYLEFPNQQTMERAARVLNGSVFQGWKINVSNYRQGKQPASEDAKKKISSYMSNKPQQARAVAIVMADLLRTALHDAQRAIIDTAIKEAFDAHRSVALVPHLPREVEGATAHPTTDTPTPAAAASTLDIRALPSFRKPTTASDSVSSSDAAPKRKKTRRVVRHHESESEEEDIHSDAQSSSSEEVEISSSDEDEEDEVVHTKKPKYKRKDLDDMIPYKG